MAPILTPDRDPANAEAPPAVLLIPPEPKPKTAIEEDDEAKAEKGAGANMSPALLKLKNATEMETKAWLDAIVGEAAIKVSLIRKEPKFHRDPDSGETVKTDGTIASYDRTIDEDEIQRMHGGGTYQLSVKTRNNRGQWTYFGAKTIEIAGDPNLKSIPRTPQKSDAPTIMMPQKDPTEGKLLDKTFGFLMEEMRGQRHHQPDTRPTGIDPMTMQAMIKPLEIQISNLTSLLAQKDAELARVRETAGKDPFRDKLLETMMDGESSRINALRAMHESEVKQLKEGFRQELELERARAERELSRIEKQHEREMAAIKASNDQAIALSTQKGDITKMVLEREANSKEKENERLQTELTALRAKKEMSIKEKVEELAAIKDLVGDGDGEEQSMFEKVIGAVGSLPAITALAERAGAGSAPAQQQVAQQPQRPQLVRDRTTGAVGVRKPNGEIVPVKKRPVQVATADGTQVEIPALDPQQVKDAVTYMEGAFRNNTDPVMFASTARPFVSDPMMGVIRTLGIGEFLTKVGKIDGTSVLSTLRGRQWAKKVAAALMGEDDAPPAGSDPAPAPDDATPQG